MPPRQIFTIGNKPIRAGFGKPIQMPGKLRRQEDTFRYILVPVRIVTALTGLQIEVTTDNIGEFHHFCFGIPQFDEAAFGTAIT
jgi:hypothetical protein